MTEDSKGTDEPSDRMTIQSDTSSTSVVDHPRARKNKQNEGKVLPSDSGRKDNNGTAVSVNMDTEECEIVGMSVSTETGSAQDISADVIAQIDFEIAKSLKAALANIGNLGINKKTDESKKGTNRGGGSQAENELRFGAFWDNDTIVMKKPKAALQHRRSSADEAKQYDTVDKPFSEICKELFKQTSTVPLNFEKCQRKSSVHVNPVTCYLGNEPRTRTSVMKEDLPNNTKDVKTANKDEKHDGMYYKNLYC